MPTNEPTPRRRNGGRILVDALRLHGVDRITCMPGESFLAVLDALHDTPEIDVVICRHEGAGANMAEADGKLTGRPGICLVTRGPGATHASIGVHTASQDSTPMILLIGQVPRAFLGREAFQEIDYVRMFGGMAKWAAQIEDPAKIPEMMARAFQVALSGRPGPVVLALPEDIQREVVAVEDVRPLRPERATCPSDASAAIRGHLSDAKNPLVILGGSGWNPDAWTNIAEFARRNELPVATAFRRQDLIDNADPRFVGYLAPTASPRLIEHVKSADLILAVGTRLSEFTTGGYRFLEAPRPRAKLIHVHPSAGELGKVYQPTLAVPSGVPEICAALAAMAPMENLPWRERLRRARSDYEDFARLPPVPPGGPLGTTALMAEAEARIPAGAIVTNGAGNYSIWLHRYHRYRRFNSQLAPTSGAMGYALPAALAAKLRRPGSPVICFTGDGDFMMYPQELITAAQRKLGIVVVVVNNGMLGTIRMHQEKSFPGRVCATDLANPDFAAFARSFGIPGATVSTASEFVAAFERALSAGGPFLIDARVDPADLTPDRRLP